MKNGRLFELLYLLVERRALTAGELAERFEVSERTIYRDVDALSAAGVPVYTQRGQGDRKSTRQNSSHIRRSRMPSSA